MCCVRGNVCKASSSLEYSSAVSFLAREKACGQYMPVNQYMPANQYMPVNQHMPVNQYMPANHSVLSIKLKLRDFRVLEYSLCFLEGLSLWELAECAHFFTPLANDSRYPHYSIKKEINWEVTYDRNWMLKLGRYTSKRWQNTESL